MSDLRLAPMINVKVLGSGCPRCRLLADRVQEAVSACGLQVVIEKVTDFDEIMKWQILATPALVVNGKLVSAGRIPSESEIAAWLNS